MLFSLPGLPRSFLKHIFLVLAVTESITLSQDVSSRMKDPVVLKGQDLFEIVGKEPESIVAFKYQGPDSWQQIPMQIDEMHNQYWDVIKPGDCRIIGRNKQHLVYADPLTFSGKDEQPLFDLDDELVVMAKDLGPIKPVKDPSFPSMVRKVTEEDQSRAELFCNSILDATF